MNPEHMAMLEEARNLDRAEKHEEAISVYRRYLDVQPGDAWAWVDYGGLLLVLGRLKEAQIACHRALRIDKTHPGAMVNLGYILTKKGRTDEAEGFFRRALVKNPHSLDARLALAHCLIKTSRFDQARAELNKAIKLEPGHITAHQYFGEIFHRLALWPEYQTEIDRFRLIVPESPYVDYELGYLNLLFGNLKKGWQGYEARFLVHGLVGPQRTFDEPQWEGEKFTGKTLLLHYEQGFGDTLMFVRFASQVKALGGRVLLAAQPELSDLVATCKGIDEVIAHGMPLPTFDLQIPLLSLPRIFETDLESIPCEIPYLDIPDHVPNREQIATILAASKQGTRIGLVWAGNSIHKNDLVRSIHPSVLGPLATLSGVTWFSFQLGQLPPPPLPGLITFAPLLTNFSDTAYALSGMDLVITVDTVLAHLAGALGIPTFLLLPFSPDWRWLLNRDDSPWYPTMRIYRQPEPGNWKAVIERVNADLTDTEE